MNHPFSIGQSLSFGWQQTRLHSSLLFKIVVIVLVLEFLYALVSRGDSVLAHIVGLLITLVSIAFGIGITIITLKLARDEPTGLHDLIPPWSLAWRNVVVSVIVGVFTLVCAVIPIALGYAAMYALPGTAGHVPLLIGFAVGILAAVYVTLRYFMVKFVAVDGVQNIGTILRRSKAMTKGTMWQLLLFILVVILLNLLGAVLLLIGLLITIPVTLLASAYIYLRLSERIEAPVVNVTA